MRRQANGENLACAGRFLPENASKNGALMSGAQQGCGVSTFFRASPSRPLLGRFQQERRTGRVLFEQRRFVSLGGGEMALFDVAEAAYLFRNGGKPDGEMVVFRRERNEYVVEQGFVVGDQPAFGAAFKRAAERIEGCAAEELELRQYPECRQQPRPETHFPRQAGRLVAPRQQRRRQMKFQLEIFAAKRACDLVDE